MTFHRFFLVFVGCLLVSFWPPFEILLGSIFDVFFNQKLGWFSNPFFDAFWMDFGSPDPPKLSSRVSETLIFEKSPFSSWYRFFLNFGLQKPPKMDLKSSRKSIKKSMKFYIEKRTTFYRKREPRWGPQGVPKREFWRSLGVSFPRPLPGTQNGCKMGPKWTQNTSKFKLKLS